MPSSVNSHRGFSPLPLFFFLSFFPPFLGGVGHHTRSGCQIACHIAAPKDGIQIGANIVLTIAGVDDSDDCYGPLKVGALYVMWLCLAGQGARRCGLCAVTVCFVNVCG